MQIFQYDMWLVGHDLMAHLIGLQDNSPERSTGMTPLLNRKQEPTQPRYRLSLIVVSLFPIGQVIEMHADTQPMRCDHHFLCFLCKAIWMALWLCIFTKSTPTAVSMEFTCKQSDRLLVWMPPWPACRSILMQPNRTNYARHTHIGKHLNF